MDDINLEGAKVWTKAKAQAEADRLNEAVSDNRYLTYTVMPTEGGFAVVLHSVEPYHAGPV